MNSFWIVILGIATIYLAYNFYARRIDRNVIESDGKRATPARMYMDAPSVGWAKMVRATAAIT